MELLVSFSLSLAFGLFWLWWYYRQDIWDKEPKRLVALVFILTIPLSALTGLFEFEVDQQTGALTQAAGLLGSATFYVGVVAVVEELAKFAVVMTLAYRNRAFDEPMDGIVYAAAAALGFATFENMFYVLDKGPFVLLLRGPFTTLGHVLFSALWGAALGLAHNELSPRRRFRLISMGLVLAILAHGFFNILISLGQPHLANGPQWLSLSGLPFLLLLYLVISRKIRYALRISDFNPARRVPVPLRVSHSHLHYAPNPHRYQFQGHSANAESPPAPATRDCPNCGHANLADAEELDCYNCGSDLTKDNALKP